VAVIEHFEDAIDRFIKVLRVDFLQNRRETFIVARITRAGAGRPATSEASVGRMATCVTFIKEFFATESPG